MRKLDEKTNYVCRVITNNKTSKKGEICPKEKQTFKGKRRERERDEMSLSTSLLLLLMISSKHSKLTNTHESPQPKHEIYQKQKKVVRINIVERNLSKILLNSPLRGNKL